MRTHVIDSRRPEAQIPASQMRTHKDAIYIRAKGDKFRPLRIARPSLAKVAATLKGTKRRIRETLKQLKPGQVEPAYVQALRQRKQAIEAYVTALGKPAAPKARGLRQRIGSYLPKFFRNIVSPAAA